MWRVVLAVVLFAGCKESGGHFPVGPGGGGVGGGGTAPDAAIDGGDGGSVAPRVCLLVDPRNLAGCATTGAGGLTVTLGNASGTTADDGTFVLDMAGDATTWHVTGATIVSSVMPFGLPLIPAISTTTYDDMVSANGLIPTPGQAALMVRVLKDGAPQAGHTVGLVPQPQFATYYDSASATVWNQNSTGAYGTAWLPGADPGTPTLVLDGANDGMVPLEADSITFATIDHGTL